MSVSRSVVICNQKGLHARASAAFARMSNAHEAKITVHHDNVSADGGSIMDLLFLAASKGKTIEIVAEGSDENDALAALVTLVETRFGEDE